MTSHDTPLSAADKLTFFARMSGKQLVLATHSEYPLRLEFDPPCTILAWGAVSVRTNDGNPSTTAADARFAEILSAQITKRVALTLVRESKSFDLGFGDGAGISISLRREDRSGANAVKVILGGGNELVL